MAGAVGIIAGQGILPLHLSRALTRAGRRVILAEMAGFAAENPDGLPLIRFRAEKLGGLFKALRAEGVTDLVFAGAVRRPRLDAAQFDLKTMMMAPRLLRALRAGDDGTLRAVLAIFEAEGFAIRAAHEICPDLLPPAGVLTVVQPCAADRNDTCRAEAVQAALAVADLGQGVVVAQGQVLAVETAPGTDAMLDWVADVAGRLRPDPGGARGVFFKAPKAGQDRRVDLPAIAPATVARVARAGLAGIVLEAGGVMILDQAETLAAADAAGLFLWIRPGGAAS
ncbi:MAG: LpxI family protein [Qingshengfaniella sp.]